MSSSLRHLITFGLLFCFSSATLCGQTGHGINLANLDTNAKPCNDFYQYANGGWLAANPIPAAYSSWGVGRVLAEQNNSALHEILEEAAKNTNASKGSSEQKVGDYYASCMDTSRIEAEGLKPLQADLDNIQSIRDQKSLQKEIARLQMSNVGALFNFGSIQDFKNSKQIIGVAAQGGLGLPDRDYYTKQDDKSKSIREKYLEHVSKMFTLLGDKPADASAGAQTVMAIENRLAEASMTRVEQRDPMAIYHPMKLAQLGTLTPNFSWHDYFKNIGLGEDNDVNVTHPNFFQVMNQMLSDVPLGDWKTYLRWHLVDANAKALSSKFVDEDFRFKGAVLTGSTEILPRWKRCVAATDGALGEALGEVYVKKAFPPEAKARALDMVNNLKLALNTDLSTLSWMGDATRKQASIKLDAFTRKIGYPDKWRDYSALKVDRSSYVANRDRAARFENMRDLRKIAHPIDKTEWGMSPPTVNAYYNPLFNEIVFPAGILQPPFFDPKADDAMNYGSMGSVIGHEMTHGFDDQGRQFDSTGNLANWWTDADLKSFKDRAQCVISQFDSFAVDKDLHENGKLVVGESIADLGGLVIAYAAFQKSMEGKPRPPVIDGFTPEQRFFLAYAHGWANNTRPELARMLVTVDPHPLPKFRVNGPLSNIPAFAEAFQCKVGDAMVRPENERCQIW